MNILQVVINPYPRIIGGVDMMVSMLIPQLRAQGCAVTVFVPGRWADKTTSHWQADGVDVYMRRLRVPFGAKRPLRSLLAWLVEGPRTLTVLRRLCREHRIDVIHVHTATPSLMLFRLLRRMGGPPYIVTFHRGDVVEFRDRSRMRQRQIVWGLKGAAATTAVSGWLSAEAKRVFPFLDTPQTVYNGIRLDAADNRSAVPAKPVPAPARFFLVVGSFDPYKGHDVAIRAWAILRRTHPDVHLCIAGEGDLRPDYERLIAECDCGSTIHLIGQKPHGEILALMAASSGMVFPSRNEGFGYVILEAGLSGAPVVCSAIPPLDEIVMDGDSGLLFPAEDHAALAAAIVRLLEEPGLDRRLADGLKRRVTDCFSDETMAAGYVRFFRSRLAGAAADNDSTDPAQAEPVQRSTP